MTAGPPYPRPVQIATLGSGSKGNCLLLREGNTKVLIDAGLSLEDTLARLDRLLESPTSLTAIVVTHTHGDHVRSVRRLSQRFHLPVHAGEESFAHSSLRRLKRKSPFGPGRSFRVGECEFFPIRLSHDSPPTFGFRVECRGRRFGIATDLGTATENVRKDLRDCDALLLEFNHDRRMLEEGPYPWPLKQRVGGDLGHLSNEQASDLLRSLLHPSLRHLVLGHLSETNNRPEIALEAARRVLVGEGMEKTVMVAAAPQHGPGPTVTV